MIFERRYLMDQNIYADPDIMAEKTERWLKRLEDDKKLKDIRFDGDKLMEKIRAYNDHCNLNTPKSMKYGVRK